MQKISLICIIIYNISMELVFATNNNHKIQEISALVGSLFQIKSLADIHYFDEIPETGQTLEENALQKARYIYTKYGYNTFADDTGLEIAALGGAPGVHTARFAGLHCNSADNIAKTLKVLDGIEQRDAVFKTVIACILHGQEHLFQGEVHGCIAHTSMGNGGFGYDPIFIPQGFAVSFAQMPINQKNKISHRANAMEHFLHFLHTLIKK